ncbi:hypothetical protein S40288_05091 [Stachybotrys chartarum IBT 40288]|nr:hypothetical protein S40288_05091 [Stachybotrys chartarum IBT 40288]
MFRGLIGGKVRSNNGCYTCRLRRKKCDETRPACDACRALEITCHFGEQKPDWMDNGPRQREMADKIKAQVKKQATVRRDRRYLDMLETGTKNVNLNDGGDEKSSAARRQDVAPSASASGASDTEPQSSNEHGSTPASSSISANSPAEIPWHNQLFLRQAETDKGPDLDVHFVMIYLDYVFPHLFPFYRPPVLVGGRGWILETIQSNKVVHHTAISLASYFFSVIMANDEEEHRECTVRIVNKLQIQLEMGLRELQRDVQRFNSGKISLREGLVVLHSITQMLTFEVATSNRDNWKMHLDGAIALFMQIIPRPEHWTEALSSFYREQWPPGIDDELRRPWSTSQAALRFFTANLFFVDVMASVTLGSAPRLYRYQASIIPGCHDEDDNGNVPHTFHSAGPLAMEEFTGLNNWVVQMIGDVASLHSWKKVQSRAGSLSVHELISRGKILEDAIKGALGFAEQTLQAMDMTGICVNHPTIVTDPISELRRTSAKNNSPGVIFHNLVWLQATLTYLQTVIHGWQPSCAELQASVAKTKSYLLALPTASCLNTMAWPFCITGCLAPPEDEDEYRCMMARLGPLQVFGTMKGARDVMEKMWSIRDQVDESWDMSQCLNVLGYKVLLI